MASLITCPTCDGRGKIELSPELNEALSLFKPRVTLTVQQVWKQTGGDVTTTAINNRLEKLRAAGYLTRERKGREWLYRKAPKA